VKFILRSFLLETDETKRMASILEKVKDNEHVATYGRFSVPELKEQLRVLQSQLPAATATGPAERPEHEVIYEKTRIKLSAIEIGYLQLNFGSLCAQIRNGSYLGSYRTVVDKARLAIKTQTKFFLQHIGCKFTFDGPILDATGQGDTVFQYAHFGSTVYCAKIGPRKTVGYEFNIGQKVGELQFPSVMPVIDLVNVSAQPNEDRFALISPLYPASLSRFLGTICDADLLNTARCVLAAMACFQKAGLCHGDIKPGNMMISNSNYTIVLIDFGSAVPIDSIAKGGTTELYGLDAAFGTIFYDRVCLAVSLAHLKLGQQYFDQNVRTLTEFREFSSTLQGSVLSDAIDHILNDNLNIEELWTAVVSLLMPVDSPCAEVAYLRPDLR